jgi:hypothetical protein
MITEIVKDMSSFFIVLFYGMFGFACIQYVLNPPENEESRNIYDFSNRIVLFYRLSMGEWSFDDF